jgi:hypothetical protein
MFHRRQGTQSESATAIRILALSGNHAQSMDILAAHGLRPLASQEALSHAPELIDYAKKLKSTWFFYLSDRGTTKHGLYTYNELGELLEPKGNETHDKKVYVQGGSKPLTLHVFPDLFDDARFDLVGCQASGDVAQVVVGIKIEPPKPKGLAERLVTLRRTSANDPRDSP